MYRNIDYSLILGEDITGGPAMLYLIRENVSVVRSVCYTSNFSLEIPALTTNGSYKPYKVKNKWGVVWTCDIAFMN